MDNPSRAKALGNSIADNIIEAAHLTYNAGRGKALVETIIKRLQERVDEIQPKKAKSAYKKARYGKK